jgi:hypothetical protein
MKFKIERMLSVVALSGLFTLVFLENAYSGAGAAKCMDCFQNRYQSVGNQDEEEDQILGGNEIKSSGNSNISLSTLSGPVRQSMSPEEARAQTLLGLRDHKLDLKNASSLEKRLPEVLMNGMILANLDRNSRDSAACTSKNLYNAERRSPVRGLKITKKQLEENSLSVRGCLEKFLNKYLENNHYKYLTNLDLSHTSVTDQDLEFIRQYFPNLRKLFLSLTRVTDAGIMHLKGMSLEVLTLNGTEVTDAGILHLKGMPLRILEVGMRVTDAGIIHLRDMPLTFLGLSQTRVTDAVIKHLEDMPLNFLDISFTRVTKEGIMQLQDMYPRLSIIHQSLDYEIEGSGG